MKSAPTTCSGCEKHSYPDNLNFQSKSLNGIEVITPVLQVKKGEPATLLRSWMNGDGTANSLPQVFYVPPSIVSTVSTITTNNSSTTTIIEIDEDTAAAAAEKEREAWIKGDINPFDAIFTPFSIYHTMGIFLAIVAFGLAIYYLVFLCYIFKEFI